MRSFRHTDFLQFVKYNTLLTAVLATGAVHAGGGAVFLDQSHDFVDFVASETTSTRWARTADDFVVTSIASLIEIDVWLIVRFPNMPDTFVVDIYDDAGNRPGGLFFSRTATDVVDLGEWNGDPNLHLLRVSAPAPGGIGEGRYWVSPYGIGLGAQDTWWGTSGNGNVNGLSGMHISNDFPDWTDVSDPDLLGFESDFAMRITMLPTPGALGVLFIAAATPRTRRRRASVGRNAHR